MAEVLSSTAGSTTPQQLADMQMPVKELDAMGRAVIYNVPIPDSPNFDKWTFFQQIALLKAGTWSKCSIQMIAAGITYAQRLNLDILQGDVYSTGEGRIATSNKAKIKLAMRTGMIEDAPLFKTIELLDEALDLEGYTGPEIECTVSVRVRGWKSLLVKTQRLSDWYVAKNPNWKGRPKHMLELNTLAHTLEIVSPYAETGDDEYVAPPTVLVAVNEADLVTQAINETKLAQ